jgi:BirA family biotin operon repressor/biotin-[acetyl-CoA-carboxylase] ligase
VKVVPKMIGVLINNFHVNFVKNSNSLAGSAVKTVIGTPFTHLKQVNSTNIYAMQQLQAKLAEHGAVFFADVQTAGKGQMGKKWESEAGQNLLMSILLNVSALNMGDQFALSAAIALAARDLLSIYIPADLTIKWPNDLYWGDRKAGGILIENQITSGIWAYAVAGIGININQTQFDEVQNKAVSLKQITGKIHPPINLAKELCKKIELRFKQLLETNGSEKILGEYNEVLYKKSQPVKLKNGTISAVYTINGVSKRGDLMATSGIQHQFQHGSIEWIIEG